MSFDIYSDYNKNGIKRTMVLFVQNLNNTQIPFFYRLRISQ